MASHCAPCLCCQSEDAECESALSAWLCPGVILTISSFYGCHYEIYELDLTNSRSFLRISRGSRGGWTLALGCPGLMGFVGICCWGMVGWRTWSLDGLDFWAAFEAWCAAPVHGEKTLRDDHSLDYRWWLSHNVTHYILRTTHFSETFGNIHLEPLRVCSCQCNGIVCHSTLANSPSPL